MNIINGYGIELFAITDKTSLTHFWHSYMFFPKRLTKARGVYFHWRKKFNKLGLACGGWDIAFQLISPKLPIYETTFLKNINCFVCSGNRHLNCFDPNAHCSSLTVNFFLKSTLKKIGCSHQSKILLQHCNTKLKLGGGHSQRAPFLRH